MGRKIHKRRNYRKYYKQPTKNLKTRRSRKKPAGYNIMYANCRGIKGKMVSLKEIVEKESPDIIVLNETMYKNNEETKLKAYKSYTNNRENRSGGGIEIMVRNCVQNRTVKVSEGNEDIEELTVRTETRKRALNIISLYGKIEGRESKDKINNQFSHLEELIQHIEKAGEDYILIGDLNAKIGNKENGIKGNNEAINEAGKSFLNLEEKTKAIIVNKTEKCTGKWTRVNTKNEKEKSILDYVMTNESLYEDLIEMKIDEEKLLRLTKYKGKEIKETDHNTIIIKIEDEVVKQRKEKQHRWKTNNDEAWEKYKNTTEDNKELDKTWKNEKDTNKNWREWKHIVYKILNETLGKIRITNDNKQGIDKEVREMMKEKREVRKKSMKQVRLRKRGGWKKEEKNLKDK